MFGLCKLPSEGHGSQSSRKPRKLNWSCFRTEGEFAYRLEELVELSGVVQPTLFKAADRRVVGCSRGSQWSIGPEGAPVRYAFIDGETFTSAPDFHRRMVPACLAYKIRSTQMLLRALAPIIATVTGKLPFPIPSNMIAT